MQWLHQLLGGSSPITGYLGSIIIVLDVLNQVVVVQGPPKDVQGWLVFLGALSTGLAARFGKDANKSNAPSPTVEPVVVPKA